MSQKNPNQSPKSEPKRNSRTTIIGWTLIVIVCLVSIGIFKEINLSEYGRFIELVITLLISIGFIKAKDA